MKLSNFRYCGNGPLNSSLVVESTKSATLSDGSVEANGVVKYGEFQMPLEFTILQSKECKMIP